MSNNCLFSFEICADIDNEAINCKCVKNFDLIEFFSSELDSDFTNSIDCLSNEVRDSAFAFCEQVKYFCIRNNVSLKDILKKGCN